MAERDVISTLNTLIETCSDGEEGFREAAQNIKDNSIWASQGDRGDQESDFSDLL